VQNLTAAATPAVWGGLIGAYGFGRGFAVAAAIPLLAAALTPSPRRRRGDAARARC
jgi:hypothetical protein